VRSRRSMSRRLPQPLEARRGDAAGVVVLLGAALQLDVAVDVQDPGALAVAREGSDGRDVAVPCNRRRVMPALRDDAGEAGAGHQRVAELVLDDGERLAVLRARRRREVRLRQERIDRRGQVGPGCDGEAEGGPASTRRPPRAGSIAARAATLSSPSPGRGAGGSAAKPAASRTARPVSTTARRSGNTIRVIDQLMSVLRVVGVATMVDSPTMR
jgi:hypothetical protein